MCGRLNVIDDVLTQFVSSVLGIKLNTTTNPDLRPSQQVATIIHPGSFTQVDANWGIQPDWSKQLLINAKSETVWQKPTFSEAFAHSRCLVPCNGWYEWQKQGNKKQKFSFKQANDEPVFMAGILYDIHAPKLVTLTTEPNNVCAQVHHRMPVLIDKDNVDLWFSNDNTNIFKLMADTSRHDIVYHKANS